MDTTFKMEEVKKLPQLIKRSTTYKLIVPENVEEKIRYLIRKFPQTEWSGVLFYTYQGTFEDNNLVITCEDIFPMDLGSSGWTEFHMSEDVAAYMADNIELFDCEIGLVHSHHILGAYFSGQDVKMIQQEGDDTNCFVSLVVDTRGKYVAIVTRKVQTKSEVTIKNIGTSYEFFGDGTKSLTHDGTTSTKVVDKEVIEYFDLEVERHEVSNSLDYLDIRFEEINKKKAAIKAVKSKNIFDTWEDSDFSLPSLGSKFSVKEPSLFDSDTMKSLEKPSEWIPNKAQIHRAVVSIVTCSLNMSDKINLEQWIKVYMQPCYAKIFSTDDVLAFDEWVDFIIPYVIDHFNTDGVPQEILEEESDIFIQTVAQAIYDELFEYSGSNVFIDHYCDALANYI